MLKFENRQQAAIEEIAAEMKAIGAPVAKKAVPEMSAVARLIAPKATFATFQAVSLWLCGAAEFAACQC